MRLSTGADAETILKWATALVTLAGFFWGVDATLKTRGLDARRPFLDMQLNPNPAVDAACSHETAR